MELAVERVFNHELLQKAAKQFAVKVEDKPLGDFENYLFRATTQEGKPRVLRLTHSSHRSLEQIEAELSFLDYVGKNGANVAKPYVSVAGNLVEKLPATDGTNFFAALFDFAEGSHVKDTDPAVWNDHLFRAWGQTVGCLHRLTIDYPHTPYRMDWEEDEMALIETLPMEGGIKEIAYEIVNDIQKLPLDKNAFGLIHSDVHQGNFFYKDGTITVFDFDDLTYHFFIHDLAMVLYYSVLRRDWTEEEKTAFARHQLACLREGYETEHVLEDQWYETLPLFMRLRDITLYATILKKFEGKAMTERFEELANQLCHRIKERRSLLEL
ncbi:phosphotransferase enzyme family protein [Microbacteriaceae bacterium 4G12]